MIRFVVLFFLGTGGEVGTNPHAGKQLYLRGSESRKEKNGLEPKASWEWPSTERLTCSNYKSTLQGLIKAADSRYIASKYIEKAETFIAGTFKGSLGQNRVESQPFDFHSTKCKNIIGILQGDSNDFIVVGAHYDSLPAEGKAPGADDNGSGVAALLEVVRLMAQRKQKPKLTVVFAAVSAEEEGLVGSTNFVKSQWFRDRQRLGRFHGALIMDQVGASMGHRGAIFETNLKNTSKCTGQLVEMEISALQSQNTLLKGKSEVDYQGWGSDHMPFLRSDLPAVLVISEANRDSAHQFGHTSNDTIDKVDFEYATDLCSLVAGAAALLASGLGKPSGKLVSACI